MRRAYNSGLQCPHRQTRDNLIELSVIEVTIIVAEIRVTESDEFILHKVSQLMDMF